MSLSYSPQSTIKHVNIFNDEKKNLIRILKTKMTTARIDLSTK